MNPEKSVEYDKCRLRAKELLCNYPTLTEIDLIERIAFQILIERQKVEELEKELSELRNYCTLTFGFSHPEIKKCPHESELELWKNLAGRMKEALENIKKHNQIVCMNPEALKLSTIQRITEQALAEYNEVVK